MRAKFTVAVLSIGFALGQERVQLREVERVEGFGNHQIADIIDRIRVLSFGDSIDSGAQKMLSAAVEGSERFIRWKLPNPAGVTTLVHEGLDILAAHWEDAGRDDLSQDIWMWDDPDASYFFLPLPESRVTDRAGFKTLLDSLFVWWEPPPPPPPAKTEREPEIQPEPQGVAASAVAVPNDSHVPPPPPPPPPPETPKPKAPNSIIRVGGDPSFKTVVFTLARISGGHGLVGRAGVSIAEPVFQQGGPGQFLSVELYHRSGSEWLVIGIGKQLINRPQDMFRIAERFPALRERVPRWSMERLLGEFGRELIPDRFASDERDSILLDELVKRDLTLRDAHELIGRSGHGQADRRKYMIVKALVQAGKTAAFESFIREQIQNGCAGPEDRSLMLTESMIWALQDVNDIDVSDLAVGCQHNLSPLTALRYLKLRAHTAEIYDALQKTVFPPMYEEERQQTLSAIKARLR
jgi:hypothetical protein